MPAALQLTDSQNCDVTVTGAIDKKGNPAPLDGNPTFASSDQSKLTVILDPNDPMKCTLSAVGPLTASGETVVVSIDGDGKIGPDVVPIHDEIAVTIVAGDAVAFGITTGTPVEQ